MQRLPRATSWSSEEMHHDLPCCMGKGVRLGGERTPQMGGESRRLLASCVCQAILTRMGVIAADALSTDPLEALRELARSEPELERLRRDKVLAARAAGATWEQVGNALGMSRQSAWEYFTARIREELADNVTANAELSEVEAMQMAVDEVRSVRRRRRH